MDLDYFYLRAHLYPKQTDNMVSFKLNELIPLWNCTVKNVKRKLKKYHEQQLFIYQPGIGRGNASTLRFASSFEKELQKELHLAMQKHHDEKLLALLQLPVPKQWFENISTDFNRLLGFQTNIHQQEILRSIVSRPLSTLDPVQTAIAMESFLLQQFGDTLVKFNPEKKTIKPHLAHHWKVSNACRTWTFYLRKGVQFHHGKTLTSEDVIYSFERAKTKKGSNVWMLEEIVTLEANSTFSVTFHLEEANPFFIRYLCQNYFSILPSDIPFDEYKWIGTGPFKMKERSQEKLILEAFDQYFLERPLLDRIEFWFVQDKTYRAFNFEVQGQKQGKYVEQNDRRSGFNFLAFNLQKETIVQKKNFRKAMFHIIDVVKMNHDINRYPFYPASSFFATKSKLEKKQPELVKHLLKEANYSCELLHLYYMNHYHTKKEALWLVEACRTYGIALVPHPLNHWDEFYTDTIELHADMMLNGEVPSADVELSFIDALLNKSLAFQRFFSQTHLSHIHKSVKTFKLLETEAAREKKIDEIERYIKDNHLIVFMQHPLKRKLFHDTIKGLVEDAYGYVDLRKLWLENEMEQN